MVAIVKTDGTHLNLPEFIQQAIQEAPEVFYTYPPPNKKGKWEARPVSVPRTERITFYYVVSDISELIVRVSVSRERAYPQPRQPRLGVH